MNGLLSPKGLYVRPEFFELSDYTFPNTSYRRHADGTWTDETTMLYIDKKLTAALDLLDSLDQLFQSSTGGENRLGELLEVRIIRRVNETGSETLRGGGSCLCVLNACHDSSSRVAGSAAATADPSDATLGDAAGSTSSGAPAALSSPSESSPEADSAGVLSSSP